MAIVSLDQVPNFKIKFSEYAKQTESEESFSTLPSVDTLGYICTLTGRQEGMIRKNRQQEIALQSYIQETEHERLWVICPQRPSLCLTAGS